MAARLITDDPRNARGREARCVPTRRGRALFGEGGWDPYMEDPGTLWLLHWLLLAPKKSRLPVWWLVFNEFNAVEFAEDDLEAAVSGSTRRCPGVAQAPPQVDQQGHQRAAAHIRPGGQNQPGSHR